MRETAAKIHILIFRIKIVCANENMWNASNIFIHISIV